MCWCHNRFHDEVDGLRPITRQQLAFLLGTPLAWAVLLWFHPDVPPDDLYGGLRDEVTTYQVVHVGTLIFIGLMGLALYTLVRDLPGKAAATSRLAIGPFVLFYSAWETVIGLATGALVQAANDAPPGQRPAVAAPPIGPIGLACFAGVVLVLYRGQRGSGSRAPQTDRLTPSPGRA